MNAPPATATRDAAFLALVLADALKLGLPDPDYITMSPCYAGSATTSAVDFQFNEHSAGGPLPALQAWADRFGATIRVSADSDNPLATWHKFEFTHSGVLFHAYGEIFAAPCGAVAPHSGVTCARPAGHNGFHESGHTPAIVWERASVASDEAAAVLAASIDAGTPVVVEDEPTQAEIDRCGYSEDPYHRCRVCYDYAAGKEREHPLTAAAAQNGDDDEPRHAARISNRLGPVTP